MRLYLSSCNRVEHKYLELSLLDKAVKKDALHEVLHLEIYIFIQ